MNFCSPQAEASVVLLAVLFRSRYVLLLSFLKFMKEVKKHALWKCGMLILMFYPTSDSGLERICSLIDIIFFVFMLVLNVVVTVPLTQVFLQISS